jgi:peptidyl-prolyl cis-trans isomerase B (cyclophilin B)
VFLAEQGYFDGTVSHRIAPGFVIQAGDPTATGRGGPGYVVPDELPPEGFAYETGILAMAHAGAGTTGSQFFIVTGSIDLPPSYSVFGAVLSGYEVIDEIESVPLAQRPNSFEVSVPLESVYIETITIDR